MKTGTEATVVFDVCLRDYDLLDKKTIAFSSTLSSSPLLFLPPLNAESKRNNETREPVAIEYKTDTERGGTRSSRDKQLLLLFTLLSKVGRELPPTRNECILN